MIKTNSRDLLFIPEVVGLDARSSIMRIPPELDVPLTSRVRRLVDSSAFRRLANTSQLGFVNLVYPGATHTRFEHSLGVYRLTLLLLKRLAYDERFAAFVSVKEAHTLILASLLHDIGHFPYCHLLEDLKAPGSSTHEEIANEYLSGELAPIIREDWDVEPENVSDVLLKRTPKRQKAESETEYERRKTAFHLLSSILSGPIDVDKMDYLMRDSHAAGVPYGKNYDLDRLVGSICLNEFGDGIAITSKGKTAAELMVFARYVMFSEVYWHHAARSATAMFQRLVDCIARQIGASKLFNDFRSKSDANIRSYLLECCYNIPDSDESYRQEALRLYQGLFGEQRVLFKRIQQFSAMEEPGLYRRIAGRPYAELRALSNNLASQLSIPLTNILIDAPPVDKEVEFKIDVFYPDENTYRPLSEVSPVVRALAKEQFDDYVKRVRIFAAPEVVQQFRETKKVNLALERALEKFESR
ncbi:MAG: HD domain-containing protein [Thermoguttaceae bacterium]|jgi:HD superfamily phosphohydrolase|nr:HD domain-containing protein [Thermoguttaceae bacterium]